jgi:hypothetical protein
VAFSPERPGLNYFPCAVSIETQLAMQIWKPKEDFMMEELDQIEHIDRITFQDLEI